MYISYNQETKAVTIDGNDKNAPIRDFGDDKALQLRQTRTEESDFRWDNKKIKTVSATNVTIYDEIDVLCLRWLVFQGYVLDFSKAKIAPRAVDAICETLKGMKAAKGSTIGTPFIAGGIQMHLTEKIETFVRDIGFNAPKRETSRL
ncbi:MAG: hypothetical protein S4CHLAM20_10900 [Chlamydiia bacterium]|nr:hypothetical protein [Chlamydiia bacterium]